MPETPEAMHYLLARLRHGPNTLTPCGSWTYDDRAIVYGFNEAAAINDCKTSQFSAE